MKVAFSYIWSIWCIFWLLMLILFYTPILVIGLKVFGKRSHNTLQWIPIKFSRFFLFIAGIKVNVSGTDKFNPKEQYIYISNHSSSIDQYLTTMFAPLGRYLAKAEILKIPGFGIILKHLHIPVRRNDKVDRKRSLRDMVKAIDDGKSPIIYVEGTRNNTENLLLPFKKGAFILAKETNTPIVMVTWTNIRSIVGPKDYKIKPGTIYGICDGPFYPDNYENVESMSENLRNVMLTHLEKAYPDGKLPLK